MLSTFEEERKIKEAMIRPRYTCPAPLQVIGVQKESPVCWSGDGKWLAFVLGNKTICVHQAVMEGPRKGEFEPLSLLEGHQHPVKELKFHPTNPDVLVSVGYEGVFIWSVGRSAMVKQLSQSTLRDAHSSDVLCLEWAVEGSTLLTGSKDSDVKVWDYTNDYALMETIVGHKASVLSIRYDPTTKLLATAGRDSTIKIWNGKTLDLAYRERRADDSGIKCALLHNLDGHRGDITTLSWLQSYILLSGARDNTIKVWDCRNGTFVRDLVEKTNPFGKHRGDIRRMLPLPGGQHMITCSLDSCMKLWKVTATESKEVIELSDAKRDEAEAKLLAAILTDGREQEEAKAVATSDQVMATVPLFESEGVWNMALNPASPLLATSSSANAVKLWHVGANIAKPQLFQEFRGHLDRVNEACLIGDDRLVTVSEDYFIHLYNVDSTERPRHISFDASVLCAAVRPASGSQVGYVLAGGADYSIKAYRMDNVDDRIIHHERTSPPEPHELVATRFEGHAGRVNTIAIRPDGKVMASGGFDYAILLWKIPDEMEPCAAYRAPSGVPRMKPLTRVNAHKGHIMCMRFGPDNLLASCSNDHSVKVWKYSKNMLRTSLSPQWTADEVHDSCVSAVHFGRGRCANVLFSSSWDRSVCVFSTKPAIVEGQAQPITRSIQHEARVTDMDVSATGEFLVTLSVDQSALVWQIDPSTFHPTPLVKCTISVTNGFPSAVACGSNIFVSCTGFGQIMVWPFPNEANMDRFVEYRGPVASTEPISVMDVKGGDAAIVTLGMPSAAKQEGETKKDVAAKPLGAGVGAGVGAGAGAGAGLTAATPAGGAPPAPDAAASVTPGGTAVPPTLAGTDGAPPS